MVTVLTILASFYLGWTFAGFVDEEDRRAATVDHLLKALQCDGDCCDDMCAACKAYRKAAIKQVLKTGIAVKKVDWKPEETK